MWEKCKELQEELVKMRRELHQIPELGGNLPETRAYVEAKLNELGFYTGAIDGIFDNETQQALINFQTAYGLIIDGTINEQVVAALGIQI